MAVQAQKHSLRKSLKVVLISLACTFVVLLVHRNKADSFLSEASLNKIISFHKQHPVFVRRPLTTFLIENVASLTRLSEPRAFVLVNFGFIFLNGIVLFFLSGLFTTKFRNKVINMLVYFTSASILYSFYQPVYSYDEPAQYFFIFLSLFSLATQRNIAFIFLFLLALVTRETSLLALPGLFLIAYHQQKRLDLRISVSFLTPILLYILFMVLLIKSQNIVETTKLNTLSRFDDARTNFTNSKHVIETVSSLILVLALPMYFLIKNKLLGILQKNDPMIRAFLATALINSVVVLLTAKAREFRLFALPLCFFWPIAASVLIHKNDNYYNSLKKIFRTSFSGVFLLIAVIVSYIFSMMIYETTIGNRPDNYFNEYLFVSLLIISIDSAGIISERGSRKRSDTRHS